MKLKLRKIGNSYGVIFPKEAIEDFIDDFIEVEIIYPKQVINKDNQNATAD